jgi:hypothetical protein
MRGMKAFLSLAVIAAVGVLSSAAAAGSSDRRDQVRDAMVIPCSLYGINPAWHPDLFGNPATAKAYGFVRSPDGTWHVAKNCVPYSHSN